MSYLNCPRCRLSIEVRSRWLAIVHCPRCVARSRTLVELFHSQLSAEALYAGDSLPDPVAVRELLRRGKTTFSDSCNRG